MRKSLLPGLLLVLAAVIMTFISAALELELEPVALLGVATGGMLALVPDRGVLTRVAGFALGLVFAWIGYVLRAAVLPDSAGGRAVAVGLVLLLCVAVAAVAADRIPLWSMLLGAAAMAGAYEYSYAAAPPELAATSVSAVTALLMTTAVGFIAAAALAPVEDAERSPRRARDLDPEHGSERDAHRTTSFDDMMETTK